MRWFSDNQRYITLHIGAVFEKSGCILHKSDIVSFYNDLLYLLKKVFRVKKIIQIDTLDKLAVQLHGTELLRLDECCSSDLEFILRKSWFHIDSEYNLLKAYKECFGDAYCIINEKEFSMGYDLRNKFFNVYSYSTCMDTREIQEFPKLTILNIAPFQVIDRLVEWEYLEHVKSGIILHGITSTEIESTGVMFDEDFVKRCFPSRYVYFYEKREVCLKELYIKFEKDGTVFNCPIIESPAYQLLLGNHKKYDKLLEIEETEYYGEINPETHSKSKFFDLCNVMERSYDERYKIIVWPDHWICDGHHRASYLSWRFGEYYRTEVITLYSVLLCPFQKIPYNSRIIIYGFGYIGRIYAKQVKLSNYAQIVYVIDRNANRMKSLSLQYDIPIITVEHFFLTKRNYDFIIIAMKVSKNFYEAKTYLKNHGVDEKKILPERYYFPLGIY